MNYPALGRDDIIRASRREAIIQETAAQIIKDFAEFSLDIVFSGNSNSFYDELYQQMRDHVANLMQESQSLFQALLYRIDIRQKDIDMYHRQMPNAIYADVMTELIIHREIKKVLVRDYFRTHGTSSTQPADNTDDED
ncbi:MAG: hypothetical protein JXR39_01485 [Marinilabiliaceae bacterium]|nr:hypothetical protein [Marinilabiliaceae bacterium]